MKKPQWAWLAFLILALLLLAACSSAGQNETPNPAGTILVDTSATVSPSPQPSIIPTVTNTPTSQSPLAQTPTAEPTTLPVVRPTAPLPTGWRLLGNEKLGLQIGAPQTWSEMTALLRNTEVIGRFGPRMLLVTDSEGTGGKLIAGSAIDQGAYVFGFVAEESIAESEPQEILADLLTTQITTATEPIEIEALSIQYGPAAIANLNVDPLGVFPANNQSMRYRILTILQTGTDRPAHFLLATPTENWDAYQQTFLTMMDTISLPLGKSIVQGHLQGDNVIRGRLEKETGDIWTFNGEGGRYATINVTPDEAGIDLVLSLLDSAGNVLFTVDDGYAGDAELLIDARLPETGSYMIEVVEFFNETGDYELDLRLMDEPQFSGSGRIEFGQEIEAELAVEEEHVWTFDGIAGKDITIVLSSLDDRLDIILEVYEPDGNLLDEWDEGFAGDAEVVTGLELPVTGMYAIHVRGFGGRPGLYTLSLDEGDDVTANFYEAGDLLNGQNKREFLRTDEIHAWFIDGKVGDEARITVIPDESHMDMDIWLLDPELNELVLVDESLAGEPEVINYALPVDGQYIILVREFFGESGEYEIAFRNRSDSSLEIAGSIDYGQTVSGTMAPGTSAGWTFNGQAGETIDAFLTPAESSRDMVLVLFDPAGEIAITVDAAQAGLPERLLNFELDSDGEWMLVIREFFVEGGRYAMTLFRHEVPATELPVRFSDPYSSSSLLSTERS